jgi:hypothetical protein
MATMKHSEIVSILQAWMEKHRAVEAQLDKLYAVTYSDPGSPLHDAIYLVMDAHTKAVSRIVGDESEWLTWFEHECEFGERPKEAGWETGRMTKVRTIKQLARLIERTPS